MIAENFFISENISEAHFLGNSHCLEKENKWTARAGWKRHPAMSDGGEFSVFPRNEHKKPLSKLLIILSRNRSGFLLRQTNGFGGETYSQEVENRGSVARVSEFRRLDSEETVSAGRLTLSDKYTGLDTFTQYVLSSGRDTSKNTGDFCRRLTDRDDLCIRNILVYSQARKTFPGVKDRPDLPFVHKSSVVIWIEIFSEGSCPPVCSSFVVFYPRHTLECRGHLECSSK